MSKFISPVVRTTEKDLTSILISREVKKRLSGNSILGGDISQIPTGPNWVLSAGIWSDNGVWLDNQPWLDN